MAAYTRNMPSVAFYWRPGPNDGFGSLDFSGVAPVAVRCRWENKQELFRDAQAREQMSQAIVYPDQPVEIGGYLALGDFSADVDSSGFLDPATVDGAKEIRQAQISPSLNGNLELTKAFL